MFHLTTLIDRNKFEAGTLFHVSNNETQVLVGELTDADGDNRFTAQSVLFPASRYTSDQAKKKGAAIGGVAFEAASDAVKHVADPNPTKVTQSTFDRLLNGESMAKLGPEQDELPTEDIKDVEILAPGTWRDSSGRKVVFTPQDMEAMVRNFNELKGSVKPMLKLVHLDPKTQRNIIALPSMGWLHNFRLSDKKHLVVDVAKVPRQIAKLIRAGGFARISAEVFDRARPFFDSVRRKFIPNVVAAAGILGAQTPAVKTLKDMLALYTMPLETEAQELLPYESDGWAGHSPVGVDQVPLTFYDANFNEPKGGETDMGITQEEADKMVADAVAKADKESAAKLTEALGLKEGADVGKAFTDLSDKVKLSTEVSAKAALAEHDREVKEVVDRFVKSEQLLPAQVPTIERMLEGDLTEEVEILKADGKTVTGSRKDSVIAYLESLPKQFKKGEAGKENDPLADGLFSSGGLGVPGSENIPADVLRFAKEEGYTIDEQSVVMDHNVNQLMAKDDSLDYEGALCRLTSGSRIEEPFLPEVAE